MNEHRKPDLSTVDPIGRAPDAAEAETAEQEAGRVGRVGAAVSNTPPAVGVEADADDPGRDTEPETSPETEEQLDRLRRG